MTGKPRVPRSPPSPKILPRGARGAKRLAGRRRERTPRAMSDEPGRKRGRWGATPPIPPRVASRPRDGPPPGQTVNVPPPSGGRRRAPAPCGRPRRRRGAARAEARLPARPGPPGPPPPPRRRGAARPRAGTRAARRGGRQPLRERFRFGNGFRFGDERFHGEVLGGARGECDPADAGFGGRGGRGSVDVPRDAPRLGRGHVGGAAPGGVPPAHASVAAFVRGQHPARYSPGQRGRHHRVLQRRDDRVRRGDQPRGGRPGGHHDAQRREGVRVCRVSGHGGRRAR